MRKIKRNGGEFMGLYNTYGIYGIRNKMNNKVYIGKLR